MENENELGLSEDDLANVRQVMNELIDVVAKFNGLEEITEADYANLKTVIDFANFIVSGIIYANAIDLCANHEHHDDEDGVE
jgi:hypothetical protein